MCILKITLPRLDTELAYFYENTLSLYIKALYDRAVGNETEFENWFNENFENESVQ